MTLTDYHSLPFLCNDLHLRMRVSRMCKTINHVENIKK